MIDIKQFDFFGRRHVATASKGSAVSANSAQPIATQNMGESPIFAAHRG
jgi:hypothetical protein